MWTLLVGLALASPAEFGPWDGAWAPVGDVAAGPQPTAPRAGTFEAAYRWYRARRSPRDGARCPFYPTCSGYGILAVRERGVLVGGLLTWDRLMREYPWMDRHDHYPIVTPHETPRLYDPVPPARERAR